MNHFFRNKLLPTALTAALLAGMAPGASASSADITYDVDPGESVAFSRADFKDYFDDEFDGDDTFRYVVFTPDSSYKSSNGLLYTDYDGDDEESFSKSALDDYDFYYSSDSYGEYPINDLSFVADEDASDGVVTLAFRAYGDDGHVDGTLAIAIGAGGTAGIAAGSIRYNTTYGIAVQLDQNDIARYFQESCPGSTLESVTITGVPSAGSLYYNYYGASQYMDAQVKLTASNCGSYSFLFSPTSASQYALSELTYLPSSINDCQAITFRASGSGSESVTGTILISVTLDTVSEVYGTVPAGSSISFPAASIAAAVKGATGLSLGSVQLLALPASSAGTVYTSTSTSTAASTGKKYSYTDGTLAQLRFVGASGFTGSVEIPYVAYDDGGDAIASGVFALGVVNSLHLFTDVTSSTWCYKYVTELSDAGVIDGYADGSFQPNKAVTYGQALKLVMLAAGYSQQAPTGSSVFSGYLTAAQADGLVSGTVNLDASITRLQMAQLAARAMKLSTSGLSAVKPFTDTSDVYVQALNAAGIVEGYFSSGTSTFKPGNTLTRGQIAAIVWRMQQYNG